MGQTVKLTKSTILILKKYFTFSAEKIAVIFLKQQEQALVDVEIRLFDKQDYKLQNYYSSSLKPSIILTCITYAAEKKYDSISFVHNHPIFSPNPSINDLEALQKISNYLTKHNYSLDHCIGIYSYRKIHFVFSDHQHFQLSV